MCFSYSQCHQLNHWGKLNIREVHFLVYINCQTTNVSEFLLYTTSLMNSWQDLIPLLNPKKTLQSTMSWQTLEGRPSHHLEIKLWQFSLGFKRKTNNLTSRSTRASQGSYSNKVLAKSTKKWLKEIDLIAKIKYMIKFQHHPDQDFLSTYFRYL